MPQSRSRKEQKRARAKQAKRERQAWPGLPLGGGDASWPSVASSLSGWFEVQDDLAKEGLTEREPADCERLLALVLDQPLFEVFKSQRGLVERVRAHGRALKAIIGGNPLIGSNPFEELEASADLLARALDDEALFDRVTSGARRWEKYDDPLWTRANMAEIKRILGRDSLIYAGIAKRVERSLRDEGHTLSLDEVASDLKRYGALLEDIDELRDLKARAALSRRAKRRAEAVRLLRADVGRFDAMSGDEDLARWIAGLPDDDRAKVLDLVAEWGSDAYFDAYFERGGANAEVAIDRLENAVAAAVKARQAGVVL